MRETSKRFLTVTLLLVLLVPGVVASSGDGDIPEMRPTPLTGGSVDVLAEYETDLNGYSLWDLALIAVQTIASILP